MSLLLNQELSSLLLLQGFTKTCDGHPSGTEQRLDFMKPLEVSVFCCCCRMTKPHKCWLSTKQGSSFLFSLVPQYFSSRLQLPPPLIYWRKLKSPSELRSFFVSSMVLLYFYYLHSSQKYIVTLILWKWSWRQVVLLKLQDLRLFPWMTRSTKLYAAPWHSLCLSCVRGLLG